MSTIPVKYIGPKAGKRDWTAGTGTIWENPGDVHDIPEAAANILLQYPDVWVNAEPLHMPKRGNAWAENYAVAQAADENDKIELGVIPAGVTVDFLRLKWEDTGTGNTVNLGYEPVEGEEPEAVLDYWVSGQDTATEGGIVISAADPVHFEQPVKLVLTVLGAGFTETPAILVNAKGISRGEL